MRMVKLTDSAACYLTDWLTHWFGLSSDCLTGERASSSFSECLIDWQTNGRSFRRADGPRIVRPTDKWSVGTVWRTDWCIDCLADCVTDYANDSQISSTGKWEVKVIFHQPLHFLGRITWKPVHLRKCIVPIRNVMKSWPVALYSITSCQSAAGGSYRVIFVLRCTPTRTVRWDVNVSARPSVRPTPPTVRTALVLIGCLRQHEVCRQMYASTGILSVRIMAISVVLLGHLHTVTFNIKWKRGDGQRAISPWSGSLYFALPWSQLSWSPLSCNVCLIITASKPVWSVTKHHSLTKADKILSVVVAIPVKLQISASLLIPLESHEGMQANPFGMRQQMWRERYSPWGGETQRFFTSPLAWKRGY